MTRELFGKVFEFEDTGQLAVDRLLAYEFTPEESERIIKVILERVRKPGHSAFIDHILSYKGD